MKNDQKSPFYPSVLFSCMLKQINPLFNAEQDKALTWAIYELGI